MPTNWEMLDPFRTNQDAVFILLEEDAALAPRYGYIVIRGVANEPLEDGRARFVDVRDTYAARQQISIDFTAKCSSIKTLKASKNTPRS